MRYRYFQGHDRFGRMLTYVEGEEDLGPANASFTEVYRGEVEGESDIDMLENLFELHNEDDRPDGWRIRSMSVGDLVQLGDGPLYLCAPMGWKALRGHLVAQPEKVHEYTLRKEA